MICVIFKQFNVIYIKSKQISNAYFKSLRKKNLIIYKF